MGRPFYPYETEDPDLDWLISNFLYERPEYYPVESGMLPITLIPHEEPDMSARIAEAEFLSDLKPTPPIEPTKLATEQEKDS